MLVNTRMLTLNPSSDRWLGNTPHPLLSASQSSGTSGVALLAALPWEGPSPACDRDLLSSSPLASTTDKPLGR